MDLASWVCRILRNLRYLSGKMRRPHYPFLLRSFAAGSNNLPSAIQRTTTPPLAKSTYYQHGIVDRILLAVYPAEAVVLDFEFSLVLAWTELEHSEYSTLNRKDGRTVKFELAYNSRRVPWTAYTCTVGIPRTCHWQHTGCVTTPRAQAPLLPCPSAVST